MATIAIGIDPVRECHPIAMIPVANLKSLLSIISRPLSQADGAQTIISFWNSVHNVLTWATGFVTAGHALVTYPFFLVSAPYKLLQGVFRKRVGQ